MGWRERDWAKLRDDERRALWDVASDRERDPAPVRQRSLPGTGGGLGRRIGLRPGAAWAVLLSAALLVVLGQFPKVHPWVPALHFKLPALRTSGASPAAARDHSPRYVRIRGPRTVPAGAFLTTHGTISPSVRGPLLVQGRWQRPGHWKTLAGGYARKGSYTVRFRLLRRGVVHVRIALPDGTFALSKILVE